MADALSAGDFDSFITQILRDHYDPAFPFGALSCVISDYLGATILSSVDETGFDKGAGDILVASAPKVLNVIKTQKFQDYAR